MAPRQRRAQVHDSDSSDGEFNTRDGNDSDRENTPRVAKGKKRRTSGVNGHLNTDANTPERVPLRAVQLNDDAAERRRRRKSVKLPAPMANVDDVAAAEAAEKARRPSAGHHLNAVEQNPPVVVPLDVMNTNFEEWMKMATDNKINVANAWNFALIDYFHDMSLLRNNTDNSINFQKASCTLDGCVKIWTSRVDSVGTETGKLLSNLANESNAKRSDDVSDDEDGEGGHQQSEKRKKARSAEATLAKSYSQLKVKKLDLEFTVDPLFKKTCADFDEGGAGGLLLNHLSLGMGHEGSMRVVFDSSDMAGADQQDEEEETAEPENLVDISSLQAYIPSSEALSHKLISPSLIDFEFGERDVSSFDDLTFMGPTIPNVTEEHDDDDETWEDGNRTVIAGETNEMGPILNEEDFFSGEQAVPADDFGGGYDGISGMDMDGGMGGMEPMEESTPEPEMGVPGAVVPFDPRRAPNENDLMMALVSDENDAMEDYFDRSTMNWAGPEHWKLRKVVRKDISHTDDPTTRPRREKKEAFRIDFLSPSEGVKEASKKLFARNPRGGALTLPATKRGKKAGKEEQTLPDDMHFSSKQLVTLFLKPKFALRMRGRASVPIQERTDGEIDEQYWAQAAAGQVDASENDATMEGVMPFSTQFFHDDYDDGGGFGMPDADDGSSMAAMDATTSGMEVSGEQDTDLLAATQGQGRRIRPELMNYAKKAKRVDVKRLKDNIWKELNIVTSFTVEEDGWKEPLSNGLTEEKLPPTDPEEAREFSSVVTGLRQAYPKEKMEEISTSFCFICLLHLANERGLQINDMNKRPDAAEDANITDKVVGDIWGLKVYRNPDATPAA